MPEGELIALSREKAVVTVWVYFWTLMPLYIAVAVIAVAYLSVIDGQKARIDKRDQQFCDIARVFLFIEPIIPKPFQVVIDKAISDIESNDSASCDPPLTKPTAIVVVTPTPSPSAGKPVHPRPTITKTMTGPTTFVVVTKTPEAIGPSDKPKKHHHRKGRGTVPRQPNQPSKICTIESALAGRCILDVPTPKLSPLRVPGGAGGSHPGAR